MSNQVIITGGLGFIGSQVVKYLNKVGIVPTIYDDMTSEKWKNVIDLKFKLKSRYEFNEWVNDSSYHPNYTTVIMLGANVDTTEKMNDVLWENNVVLPIKVAKKLSLFGSFGDKGGSITNKLIYASSGSVYGVEEKDFSERLYGLHMNNAYAFTKLHLDRMMFDGEVVNSRLPVYGLRFFNVYGPAEAHKGRMKSIVYQAVNKLEPLHTKYTARYENKPAWNLFKSYRQDVKDGDQKRDFIYVNDICKVIHWLMVNQVERGIYNLGSGEARSYNDIVKLVDPTIDINYVEMPEDIRPHYQYYTCADISKLRKAGYAEPMTSLETGIKLMQVK